MNGLAAALVLTIPAMVLATAFRLISVEYAIGIVWAITLALVVLGLSLQLGLLRQTPNDRTQ
jgi:hypothetical protein